MRFGALAALGLCGLLALLSGCSASSETDGEAVVSCAPLSAATGNIVLATIIGAGRDSDGTIYVIDELDGSPRAFISEEGELVRQRVTGSGQDGRETTTVTLGELDPPLTVQVSIIDSSKRMGVVRGPLESKTIDIGEQGEELTLLEVDEAQALPVRDYPAEIVVEYSAELADGRQLVVLRPRDFDDYDEFRVFLGPPERLVEQPVQNVERARDGGSTGIEFSVEGETALAFFPVERLDDAFAPGDPSLSIAGKDVALSLTWPAASPESARYYCRQ